MTIDFMSSGAKGVGVERLHITLIRLGHVIARDELDAQGFGPTTRAAVIAFQNAVAAEGEPGIVDPGLDALLRQKAADAPAVVIGQILGYDGPPLDVIAENVQLRTTVALASGTTATDGTFRLEYDLPPEGAARANIQVTAFLAGGTTAVAVSAIRFAAEPVEQIDLTPSALAQPNEFDVLSSRIPPLLGNVSPSDVDDKELEFLASAAGIGLDPLIAYRAANRSQAGEPGIALRHWYAFHRANPDADPAMLALFGAERIARSLATSIARGHIAFEPNEALVAAADVLHAHGVRRVGARLEPLLKTTAAFASKSLESVLSESPESRPAASEPDLQAAVTDALPLLVLARFDPQLAGLIRAEIPNGAAPSAVAALGTDQWNAILERHLERGGALPADVSGTTDRERIETYAASLDKASESLFVTEVFARRLATLPVIDPAIAPEAALAARNTLRRREVPAQPFADEPTRREATTAFAAAVNEFRMFPEAAAVADGRFENAVRTNTARFLAESQNFDLAAVHIRDFIARESIPALDELSEPEREAVVGHVETVQRMLPIAPRARQMEALLGAGLHTAGQVVQLGEDAFAERFSADFGGENDARAAHRTASRVTAAAALLGAELRIGAESVLPRALAVPAPSVRTEAADLPRLFGSADLCACAECRSQFSPAAYFVDLLEFLNPPVIPGGAPSTPLAVLLGRRPDLQHLALSCENTNTSLPYVDLVNEVLEAFVANGGLRDTDANDTGDATEAELRALPRFTLDAAYANLAEANYPLTLPFHRDLDEVRGWLSKLGLTRLALMEALGVSTPRAVATETLELSDRRRSIIAGSLAATQTFELYGYRNEEQVDDTRWFSDSLPPGATPDAGSDAWQWEMHFLAASPGQKVLVAKPRAGLHEHAFSGAQPGLAVPNGSRLFIDVLIPAAERPRELMIQWTAGGSGEHRAFWGEDLIAVGAAGTASRHRVDALLPPADTWTRLEVPASAVDLEGRTITGLKLTLFDGGALWGAAGVAESLSWTAAIGRVDAFLERTRLELDALLDLLDTHWINPDRNAPAVTIQAPDGSLCDVSAMRLTGLDDARLEKIHRFLRLRSSQNMSIAEADLVIRNLGAGVLDETLLDRLADTTVVRKQLGSTWTEVCSLWADLDTRGTRKGSPPGADSAYLRLFGNRAIQSPLDEDLLLDGNGEIRGQNVEIGSKTALLLAVLQISADDRKRILTHLRLQGSEILSVARLSAIHRCALLARALKLPVGDLLDLIELSAAAPFRTPADTRAFLRTLEESRTWKLTIASLNYVLRHIDVDQQAPSDAAIDAILTLLQTELSRIDREPANGNAVPDAVIDASARIFGEAFSISIDAARVVVEQALPALTADGAPLAADFRFAKVNSPALRPRLHVSIRRVHIASLVIKALSLTADELRIVVERNADFGGWDFTLLPFEAPAAASVTLWNGWTQLVALAAARRYAGGGRTMLDVFAAARSGDVANVVTALSSVTGWDAPVLAGWIAARGLTAADFVNASRIEETARAVRAVRSARVGLDDLLVWVRREPDPAITAAVRSAVKARHDETTWTRVARTVTDPSREKRRAALVDFTLQMESVARAGLRNADDLYEYLLIDVSMSPCMLTSRVRLALSSIQLFIQRCLLNLEPGVSPKAIDPQRWAWMKNYRVWEANRKIFFYPENWIEPDLRDDKSQFFRELEADLIQTDVTFDTAEAAFRSYLYKLDEVSRLEVCGVCPDIGDSFYVVGRTYGQSKQHFLRRWDGMTWSGWERVPVDIQGDLPAPLLLPIVHNRRLYLFWPIFVEKSAPPDDDQLGQNTSSEKKRPRRYLEIALAYSEYRHGEWSPKKVSAGSMVSYDFRKDLRELPPRERHSLRGEVNPITNDLTVRLLVQMTEVLYVGTVYPEKPTDSTHNAVVIGNWSLKGCSGDLVVNSPLTLPKPATASFAPAYESLIRDSPVPNKTNLHGVGYRSDQLTAIPFAVRSDLEASASLATILKEAPTTFQIVPAQQSVGMEERKFPRFYLKDAFRPFVFQDATRSYWVFPEPTNPPALLGGAGAAALIGNSPADAARLAFEAILSRESVRLASLGPSNARLRFRQFGHPHVCAFMKSLNESGVPGLLTLQNQRLLTDKPSERFERYKPEPIVDPRFPVENVDFDLESAYGLYNTELFLHVPMLIAARLGREQKFADAQRWYHFLFDPTTSADEPAPARYWRALPLRNDPASGRIESLLRALTEPNADPDLRRRAQLQVENWRQNPFQPHRIARLRPIAYQKAVFMRYVDNLIDWADHLFAQDTIESINEATQLYVLASDLLGPRPRRVSRHDEQPAPTFASLHAAPGAREFLRPIEDALVRGGAAGVDAMRETAVSSAAAGLSWSPAFCVPPNERLLGYWDTVADRMFKIRHCQNIAGVVRALPLFEPPIDPALLVRAAALGVDLAAAIADTGAEIGFYRFRSQLQQTLELCNELRSFGGALLSALEKKDAEAIAILRASQESNILHLTRSVLEQRIAESNEMLQGLERTRERTSLRFQFYDQIETISAREGMHLRLLDIAQGFQLIGQATEIAAGAASLVPTASIGSAGSFGTPVVTASFGGQNLSASLNAASRALMMLSSLATYQANRTATLAAWDRRDDEWQLQADTAEAELQEIDRQIAAARIRIAVAERELANHDARVEDARAYEAALRGKYTGTELYSWMSAELSGLYFQLYTLAYRAAKRAESCFHFERDLSDPPFIHPGHWDSRRKGLLAGERLALDLRRLESAYHEKNKRDHEVTKHVSLTLHDPMALLALKAVGHCEFDLPEELFDLDYPGHYYRRLRSVSVTIPCITGPYTGVHATLTLLSSEIRVTDAMSADGSYKKQNPDSRFESIRAATAESIVTSHGQNDAGLFEPGNPDERYLPFEGKGAIGRWRLEVPQSTNAFDLDTISDVILHIRYTARFSSALGEAALRAATLPPPSAGSDALALPAPPPQTGLMRLISVRHEFSAAWSAFLRPHQPTADEHRLVLELSPDRFPRRVHGRNVTITKVGLLLDWSDAVKLDTNAGTAADPHYPGAGNPLDVAILASGSAAEITVRLSSDSAILGGRAFGETATQTATPGTWSLRVPATNVTQIDPSLTTQEGRRLRPALIDDLFLVLHYSIDGGGA